MTRALIIGGGIAGPVAGIAMRKAGLDATVHEAYDRTADGVGAYLTLAANGLQALGVLGLDTEVRARGFDTTRMAFHSGSGRRLGQFDTPLGPGGVASQTIRRSDLYVVLRDAAERAGVEFRYGSRLLGAETVDGYVRARFDDGADAVGDLLVGADGLRSVTRSIIDPDAPPARYVGLLNTGGYAEGVRVHADPGEFRMVFGKRAFFAYVPGPDGTVWWFANVPREVEPSAADLAAATDASWRAELVELFSSDRTPALELISATPDIIRPWATHDVPSVPRWHRDQMVIIGDAAHAASPASGQGASMAIEDAIELARCVRDAPGIDDALAAYEARRRERVEAVVAQGKRNGDQKAPGPVGRVLRDLLLPLAFKAMARTDTQGWMYRHITEWETPVDAAAAPPAR